MKLEHWMQIIIGSAILGTLGFLGRNQFDIKGKISSVDTKVILTDQRVSRIADVLPEVKARVAWEETNYQMTGFIISTKPEKINTNIWRTYVKLYDAKENNLKLYTLALDKKHKDFLPYVITGKVRSSTCNVTSFTELATYSSEQKESVMFPVAYNPHTSFLFRKDGVEEYDVYLSQITEEEPITLKTCQMNTWKDIVIQMDSLNNQLEEFKETEKEKHDKTE